jgi:hypothetical protein
LKGSTPNPSSLKFLPGQDVMGGSATANFPGTDTAHGSPLAMSLFGIEGVQALFFGAKFVSVTKVEEVEWDELKPQVVSAMQAFVASGEQVVTDSDMVFTDTVIGGDGKHGKFKVVHFLHNFAHFLSVLR